MKKGVLDLSLCLLVAMMFSACKSKYESQGDKHLAANDPINALMRYDQVIKDNKQSKEFPANYTKANILTLKMRSKEDPTAEFIDVLRDTISGLLQRHPNSELESEYAQILYDIAMERISLGSAEPVSSGFILLKEAENLPNKPQDLSGKIASTKQQFISSKLSEAEGYYKDLPGEPEAGIKADYELSALALLVGETSEMQDLWSKVRKANLSTYLMYDLENLLEYVHPSINKYGVLLGITSYNPSPTSLSIQVKAFNGSTGPMTFDGDKFTLVDQEGNVYKPSSKRGGFSKSKIIEKSNESGVGGLSFNFPNGTQPAYLELVTETGPTRKYLP